MASDSHHEMASDLMNPVLCDICVTAAVKFHCNTCGDGLCPTCKEYHLRSKGSRHHQIVPYAQKLNPKYLIGLSCHNHPNNAPEFWCETCGVPICVSCITDKHNGHTFSNITTKLSQKRDKMVEEMKNLRDNTVAEWEGVLKQAQGITAGYLADIEKVDKDLVARAKLMHKQVDTILSKNQSTLQQMKLAGLAKLQDQEKYLAARLQKLKGDVRRYEDKLQEADANVLLQFEESTTQSVDKPKPLETEWIPVFTPGQDDTKSLQHMFGTIAANNAGEERKQESTRSSARSEAANAKDSDSKTTAVKSPGCGNPVRSLITKPTVQSQFYVQLHASSPFIVCTEQSLAWVTTYFIGPFSSNGRIQLVNREGSAKVTINTDFSIKDMAITPYGDLLIADYTNSCIKSVSRQKISILFRTSGTPSGLCCLHNGEIVVTFGKERKVIVYSREGQVRQTLDHITFTYPGKVAVNKINQDIYICDKGKVLAVGADGLLKYEYTGQNDSELYPHDVCTDQMGHVLINDCSNHRIHILDQEGQFIQYILTSQGLYQPETIDVDSEGYVWVGEYVRYSKGRVKVARYLQ